MSSRHIEPLTGSLPYAVPVPRLRPVRPDGSSISTTDALDLAFAGELCELVQVDGTSTVMAVHRWTCDASPADLDLFVGACRGPTLDLGCGPGRLAAALAVRGVHVLGIDISPEAVRQTRERGAAALCRDIFHELPGATRWQHVVLADGNIGLGGDPIRLLRRAADLLAPDGSVLVELGRSGGGVVHHQVRLRVGQQLSPAFSWATVGADAMHDLALASGLTVTHLRRSSGRYVATLHHAPGPRPVESSPRWR